VGKRNITNGLVLLAALGLTPAAAIAAGLGKLTVLSGLGQPLKAEIEIVALQKGELESLTAKLASAAAFREANIDYGSVMPTLRFTVDRRPNRPVIVVTTSQPVEDPFLDLLVELNWSSGRLVREYTFLLDPAEYKGPQPITAIAAAPQPPVAEQPVVSTPVVTTAPVATTPPPAEIARAPEPAPTETPRAAPSPAPARAAAPAPRAAGGAAGTYTVASGDTLGKIASANKPDGVTLQQMLVAMYRANEGAFINKNMNLLRTGQVLTVPDKAAAEAVAPADANKVVVAQAQDFNEYRSKMGQAVAAAPAPKAEPQQRATGRVTAKVEDAAPAPAAAPKDQLRLSKPDQAGKAGASPANADDIAAREKALKEAKDRVADLEKNLSDLQKLVEMKNQQLAELQKKAEAAKAAPPPAAPVVAEAPKPAPAPPVAAPEPPKPVEAVKPPEPPKVEPPKPAEAPKPAEPPKVAEAPKPDAPAPAVAPPPAPAPAPAPAVAEAPKPKPKAPPPPPPPEPSLVDELLDNPVALGGGGVALLGILGLGAYAIRKKRNAKLENSLLGVTTTDTSSVFGTTGGRSVDTGASSLQTDFSQSGIGQIDTDEVDPVAEADVYMAYGRDAQAEEILKEALQKDPNRQSVRVKLLEIYAARKDLKAFETTAGELYAATGGQGTDWEKACGLGLSIDPTNPMYGGKSADLSSTLPPGTVILPGAAAAAAAAPAPTPDIDLDAGDQPAPSVDFDLGGRSASTTDIALDVGAPSVAPADLGFDLSLGEATPKATEEASDFSPSGTFIMDAATKRAVSEMDQAQTAPPDLAIDFELPGTSPAAPAFDQTAKMQASQPATTLDFDLGEATRKPQAGASQPVDLTSISFDLGAPSTQSPPVESRFQEVATKLDLAKAYEEMGDKDGARELLNEVLKEGDTGQQQQAKTLLAAMG
jgi:pilus assembly protein FimV